MGLKVTLPNNITSPPSLWLTQKLRVGDVTAGGDASGTGLSHMGAGDESGLEQSAHYGTQELREGEREGVG